MLLLLINCPQANHGSSYFCRVYFRDIVGQERLVSQLITIAKSGRLPHASVWLGPDGCGNLPLAIAFARYVNCLQPGDSEACGACSSCLKMDKLILADVHFSFPIVGGDKICDEFYLPFRNQVIENPYMDLREWLFSLDSENKQGNIPARECQEIIRKLSLTHLEATYKIQLIWMAEFLGKEGNKLLKILEEPPEKTLFFLIAHDSEKLLPTILSRCQMIRVPPPSAAAMERYFADAFPDESRESIASAVRLAGSNVRKAKELLGHQDADFQAFVHRFFTLTWGLPASSKGLFEWLDQMGAMSREKTKLLLQMILQDLLQQVRQLAQSNPASATHFSPVTDIATAEKAMELIQRAATALEWNGNPKLVMYNLSLSLQRLVLRKTAQV